MSTLSIKGFVAHLRFNERQTGGDEVRETGDRKIGSRETSRLGVERLADWG